MVFVNKSIVIIAVVKSYDIQTSKLNNDNTITILRGLYRFIILGAYRRMETSLFIYTKKLRSLNLIHILNLFVKRIL